MKRRKAGFTRIKLLVIIAILTAILFPVFARAQENARYSSGQNNLKQIAYASDQRLPITTTKFPDPTPPVPVLGQPHPDTTTAPDTSVTPPPETVTPPAPVAFPKPTHGPRPIELDFARPQLVTTGGGQYPLQLPGPPTAAGPKTTSTDRTLPGKPAAVEIVSAPPHLVTTGGGQYPLELPGTLTAAGPKTTSTDRKVPGKPAAVELAFAPPHLDTTGGGQYPPHLPATPTAAGPRTTITARALPEEAAPVQIALSPPHLETTGGGQYSPHLPATPTAAGPRTTITDRKLPDESAPVQIALSPPHLETTGGGQYSPHLPATPTAAGPKTTISDRNLPEKPVTDKPVVDSPATDKPVVDSPTTDKPVVDSPTTDKPALAAENDELLHMTVLIEPAEGDMPLLVSNRDYVFMGGSIGDPAAVAKIEVNGKPVAIENNQFMHREEFPGPGAYVLRVTATSSQGDTSERVRRVRIISPSDAEVPQEVRITAQPAADADFVSFTLGLGGKIPRQRIIGAIQKPDGTVLQRWARAGGGPFRIEWDGMTLSDKAVPPGDYMAVFALVVDGQMLTRVRQPLILEY